MSRSSGVKLPALAFRHPVLTLQIATLCDPDHFITVSTKAPPYIKVSSSGLLKTNPSMSLSSPYIVLILIFLALIIVRAYNSTLRRLSLPPGPRGSFFLGVKNRLASSAPWKQYAQWAMHYESGSRHVTLDISKSFIIKARSYPSVYTIVASSCSMTANLCMTYLTSVPIFTRTGRKHGCIMRYVLGENPCSIFRPWMVATDSIDDCFKKASVQKRRNNIRRF